jgi:hypothetical protein
MIFVMHVIVIRKRENRQVGKREKRRRVNVNNIMSFVGEFCERREKRRIIKQAGKQAEIPNSKRGERERERERERADPKQERTREKWMENRGVWQQRSRECPCLVGGPVGVRDLKGCAEGCGGLSLCGWGALVILSSAGKGIP